MTKNYDDGFPYEQAWLGVRDPDDAARSGAFLYTLGSAASAFKKCAVQAEDVQIDGIGQNEHFRRLAARLGAENPAG